MSAGFTLVELLIALSLIGLITLLLFSGLRLASRAWEGVDAAAERTAKIRVARNFLERTLVQTRLVSVPFDGASVSVFSGDAQTLELVAPLSEHVGIPGLYVVRVSLDEEQGRRLMLTRWLLHPDILDGSDEIPEWAPYDAGIEPVAMQGAGDEDLAAGAFGTTVLIDGIEEFEIRYFGAPEDEEEPDWFEEWLEQRRPPLAVHMRVTTREQSWPDMLVRLPDVEP